MKYILIIFGLFVAILSLLILVACGTPQQQAAPSNVTVILLGTPVMVTSDAASLTDAQTQAKNDADVQAAATAQAVFAKATALAVRGNAQATLNSANATLGAAQTQAQDAANVIAAQVAATALIVRANAQATLNAAWATQNAAQTQDAIHQTQTAALSTSDARAILNQQNKDRVAAGTQTAIANVIATQTQSAVATAQWYTEQRQGPITFLWVFCLPVFLVLLACLILWSIWRWVKIEQGPRTLENPVEKLPAPTVVVVDRRQADPLLYLDSNVVDHHPQLTKPDDQVGRWMDEVKDELRSSDEKDKDDRTNS